MGNFDVSDPWSDVVHDAPGLFLMCPNRRSCLTRMTVESPRYDFSAYASLDTCPTQGRSSFVVLIVPENSYDSHSSA